MISTEVIYKSIMENLGVHSIVNEIEQRIKLITDAFPAAVAYVDQNGIYQFVNSTYERWLELDRSQILGRRPREVLGPHIYASAQPHIEKALLGIANEYELKFTNPSGQVRELHINYRPGRSITDEVEGYVVVIRDISNEKHVTETLSEQEVLLRQNKKRFESITSATGIGVWYSDLPNASVVCSPQLRQQFWLPADEEVHLQAFLQRMHPEDADLVRSCVRLSIEQLQPYDVTYRVLNPKNSDDFRWIHAMGWTEANSQGEAIRFDGITVDVTAQKRFENAVIESEKRFRALANAAPVLIWSADQNRNYDWFNKAWLDYTGRSLSQELMVGWKRNLHPEDFQNFSDANERAFDQKTEFEVEIRFRRRDGEYRWFLNHGVPRFSPNQEFSGYIGTCIDIHDRRNAEIDLREAVRSRDEFLSIVSHELKTPLTSMKLRNQMIQRDLNSDSDSATFDPEKVKKLSEQTERSVDRLSRLVDDMLDISRITTGRLTLQKEMFNLSKMVRELADRISQALVQSKCSLQIEADDDIYGEWDRLRLEQVIVNLVSNAIKYGAGKPIDIKIKQQGDFAEIRVRDQGRGIAPQDHERIFQRFERAISVHEISGLGLGLYIVRQILTMHGGAIHVCSELGRGAEFVIHLPLHQ